MSAPNLQYPPPTTGGTPVGGSGTPGTIPIWNTTTALTDSPLSFATSTLTYSSAVTAQTFAANQTWTLPNTTFGLQIGAAGFNATLKIDANNRYVGIDTPSTPVTKLHIGSGSYAGANLDGVRLTNGINSYYTASDGTRTSILGADGSAFVGTLTAHDFQLRAGNAIAATVQQGTLNVGIGTASPGGRLDVQDTTNLCRLQVASASVTNRYHANVHQFLNNTAVGGVLATIQDGVGIRLSTIYSSLVFDAATAGQGLKLPATPGNADANTIDCYVDGGATAGGVAYTPTTTNFGGTISSITGRYVRVGGVVFARVDILGTALTTTAFSSTVTAPAIAASGNFAVCIRASSGTQASAYHISGGSTVEFSTSIASSSQITLTWFYFV